mmetsp:Transcript_7754/g.22803  ORF Transcript_7754/g.22803 Transcript_7754/m.22803 type:complete len:116 (-) Transcript_7754:756-1103(-)
MFQQFVINVQDEFLFSGRCVNKSTRVDDSVLEPTLSNDSRFVLKQQGIFSQRESFLCQLRKEASNSEHSPRLDTSPLCVSRAGYHRFHHRFCLSQWSSRNSRNLCPPWSSPQQRA